jgi:hypothetical protein
MGPPGGGRTFVTPRYMRHFHVVGLTEASATSLTHIFKSIQVWTGWYEALGRCGWYIGSWFD